LCGACGDAPRPVGPAPTNADSATKGDAPPGHPPIASTLPELNDPSEFGGRAVLQGELAHVTTGRMMVTLREKGQRMGVWMYVVDVGDPDAEQKGLQPAVGDTREFLFVLNKDTTMFPTPIPKNAELEVEVRYDADGNVDTKDDFVASFTPAKAGDTDLYIVLAKPGASK